MKKEKVIFWLLILCIPFIAPLSVVAQKKERTLLKAYYEKLPNEDKKISISLTKGRGKNIEGIPNASISLSTSSKDSTISMAEVQTDSEGKAILMIETGYFFPINEDGYASIDLRFSGNDSLRSSKRSIEFLNLNLALSLDVVDSVKMIGVTAFETDSSGNQKIIENLNLKIGVKRLYSNLYIEESRTNEKGEVRFEFPDDIPGDSIGMITVIAKVEDHEDYGTVSQIASSGWGTPVDYSDKSTGRSLYGDSAPLWMILTVAIILAGAWIHFLWAVFKVIRIKKLA